MNLIEMSKKCQRTKARERERGIERIIRPTDSGCKEPVEGFSFGRKRQQQINTASLLCMCVCCCCLRECVCVCVSEKREPAGKEERRASVWRVAEIVNRRL
jgi:hypothetical protein